MLNQPASLLSRAHEPSPAEHTDQAIERAISCVEASFNEGFACFTSPLLDLSRPVLTPKEVFSTIVVLEVLGPYILSPLIEAAAVRYLKERFRADGWLHFFEDPERLPPDADCTALGIAACWTRKAIAPDRYHQVLSSILGNTTNEGIVKVYLDDSSHRAQLTDPAVAANVLFAANLVGRAAEAEPSERLVRRTLIERRFLEGTRYYHCPDTFLLFVARLVSTFPERYSHLRAPLAHSLEERAGQQLVPIEAAQWALAASLTGALPRSVGGIRQGLLFEQRESGTWAPGALFKYGRKELYFGSEVLTTTFALRLLLADRDAWGQSFKESAAVVRNPVLPNPVHSNLAAGTRTLPISQESGPSHRP